MNRYCLRFPFSDTIIINTTDRILLEACAQMYGMYCEVCNCFENEHEGIEVSIAHANSDCYNIRICYLSCNHIREFQTRQPFRILDKLAVQSAMRNSNIIPLHAGGIAVGERAYIFAADTGSGKSTLIAYLAARGLKYISDDHIYFSCNNFETDDHTPLVYPYTVPIHLREDGKNVLRKQLVGERLLSDSLNKKLSSNLVSFPPIHRYAYMPQTYAKSPIAFSKLYFFRRGSSNLCGRSPFSTQEAMKRLMVTSICQCPPTATYLTQFKRIAHENCYELEYSDLHWVYEMLMSENER